MNKKTSFLKNYIYEFLALFANIATTFVSFVFTSTNIAILITVLFLTITTFIIIFVKTKEKQFYFLPMNRHGSDSYWSGIGKFNYVINENCYEITDSYVGYIYLPVLSWSDYVFEFNFKIINNCIAWIVRANNLSNYLMFQCDLSGINPHIRINGEWIIKKHFYKDTNLTFDDNLSPDTWYKAKIVCEKRNIRMVIYHKNAIIFDRHWSIPSQLLISYKKSPDPKNRELINFIQNIDFDFGAIGFRDNGNERGLFKNIYLRKL